MRLNMRLNVRRKRSWLGFGVVAVAAVVATAAFGGSGGGTITTIAGGGRSTGEGGQATAANLRPNAVAVDGQGNVYIADGHRNRVLKVSPGGTISRFAGSAQASQAGYSGDGGPATKALLYFVVSVAVDEKGNVYIADLGNDVVRRVSPGGTITTFAGTGKSYGPVGDGGPATSASLNGPDGLAVDGQGNVYIADLVRVRKVSPSGTITTVAGGGSSLGDGVPATSAGMNPDGLAVDGKGKVYIADSGTHRVRKVSPGGTITTVAGTGKSYGPLGDGGLATSARLNAPYGVAVDGKGNVYIGDTNNSRVRKVSPGGTITTFAGTNRPGFSGDGGPAISAQLSYPHGVAVDGKGNVYIADSGNDRVRKVSAGPSTVAALTLTLGGASTQRLLAPKGITVTARCNKACSLAATGSVTILGTRYAFSLSRATAGLAAGKRTLTLPFPAVQQKRFRQLVKPGQQARAVITVKATDKAGKTTTAKRTVVVRP